MTGWLPAGAFAFEEPVDGRVPTGCACALMRNGDRRCWQQRTRGDGMSRVFAAFSAGRDASAPWIVDSRTGATLALQVRPDAG